MRITSRCSCGARACEEFDPSNGDVYVGQPAASAVDKFTATGVYVAQATGITNQHGITVDTHGVLYVITEETAKAPVLSYPDAKTNEFTTVETKQVTGVGISAVEEGLGVDRQGDLYANLAAETEVTFISLCKFGPGGGLLEGPVGGDFSEVSGFGVEVSTGQVYVDYGGVVARYSSGGLSLESLPVPGEHGAGVSVGASEIVYVVDGGVVEVYTPVGPSPPKVKGGSESVEDVTSGSVVLEGVVEPDGALTQYDFQYGVCPSPQACPSAGYESTVPVPEGIAGESFEETPVGPVRITGLAPNTTYHYRLVAHSTLGEAQGEEQVFTTQASGAPFVLLDSRQWEMVSPPEKHGALLRGTEFGLVQVAANGDAITYQAWAPIEGSPLSNANFTQVLSTRASSTGGWRSGEISASHEVETGSSIALGLTGESWFFSEDLSRSILQPFGQFVPCRSSEGVAQPCLSPAASEQGPFLYSDYPPEQPGAVCTSSCAEPLVTGCPSAGQVCPAAVGELADVPAGTHFDNDEGQGCPPALVCGPQFVGASPDAEHVIVKSSLPLTRTTLQALRGGLYEWSAQAPAHQRLALVSVLPDGTPADSATLGSAVAALVRAATAVSGDGSRVVWETDGKLYLRDVGLGQTVQLDAGQAGCGGCGGGGGVFQWASSDGSRVLFTDEQRLTVDAGAEAAKPDLYECEVVVSGGVLGCVLRDLTPLEGGEAAGVQGAILGASEDASWVYFAADGIQNAAENPGAVRGDCQRQLSGAVCDVYVRHGGVTRLVGVVSAGDSQDWNSESLHHVARVSPDGEWLVFMSSRSLTGFDNRDVVSGRADEEVFVYDAASGGLACVSCDPSGARPTGVEYSKLNEKPDGGDRVWPASTWLAGWTPGWTIYREQGGGSVYQPRFLSDSGRVFFMSSGGLVPGDVDGVVDVYEWEPVGVGSCGGVGSGGGVVVKPGGGGEGAGCVGLVSSGSSSEESAFLDASVSGGDVFFLTSARLSSSDLDGAVDVYDARECSGGVVCPGSGVEATPVCVTEASCRPAPSPQPELFGAPASATFAGAGNPPPTPAPGSQAVVRKVLSAAQVRARKLAGALKACRRDRKPGVRRVCEARARKRFGKSASKKGKGAGRGRRASRSGKSVGGVVGGRGVGGRGVVGGGVG